MRDAATPGPWLVSYTGDPSHQIETAEGYIVAEGIDNAHDAILAAAAPEMFAALARGLFVLEEVIKVVPPLANDEFFAMAHAALAKARGAT